MPHVIEGTLQAAGLRFGIVACRFNSFVVDHLVEGALDALTRHGAAADAIRLVKVPGAFEVPLTVKKLAQSGGYDAIIALGAVIRGATPHFDLVCAEVAKGVAQVSLESGVPIAFGVLTTDSIEQAIERCGTKAGNKGFDSAMTAIETAQLYRELAGPAAGAAR